MSIRACSQGPQLVEYTCVPTFPIIEAALGHGFAHTAVNMYGCPTVLNVRHPRFTKIMSFVKNNNFISSRLTSLTLKFVPLVVISVLDKWWPLQ